VVFTAQEDRIWVKFYDGTGKQLVQKLMAKGETWTVPADAVDPKLWTGRPMRWDHHRRPGRAAPCGQAGHREGRSGERGGAAGPPGTGGAPAPASSAPAAAPVAMANTPARAPLPPPVASRGTGPCRAAGWPDRRRGGTRRGAGSVKPVRQVLPWGR
jgi:hypothetical protein